MFTNLISDATQIVVGILVVVLMIVVLFVMPMLSNRKRQKEANEVLDSLAVGDEIMTIGGIMGKIVELTTHESGEKLMVIETGEDANKTTMTFTVQALRLNYTKTKQRQEQLAKEKAARESAKGKNNNNGDASINEQESVESNDATENKGDSQK